MNMKKNNSAVQVMELPREIVECPSPEIPKNHLDIVLCQVLWDDTA